MNILFLSSGNNRYGISPVVLNQGISLEKEGVNINYFTIKGKGLNGYLNNILKLRKFIFKNSFDLIHAHYSLSAFIAALSIPYIPIIVSLMGSDAKMGIFWRLIINLNARYFWKAIIVKSNEMKIELGLKKAYVLPNGVDLSKFRSLSKTITQSKLNLNPKKKHILFLANPSRFEKNFKLAEVAVNSILNNNIILHAIFNKTQDEIVDYLHASDVLLNTSLWEGSPNVIKEAMACNVPIVSTDVGDVKWVIGDTDGCYISSFEPTDVAEKIKLAIQFSNNIGKTKGRNRIIELGLDSKTVARKIIDLYKSVLK